MPEYRHLFAGEPTTFAKAFPTVKTAVVTVEESGDFPRGYPEEIKSITYRDGQIAETIRCHNPLCQQGGLDIGSTVRWMVDARTERQELSQSCPGHEGSPKGRRKGMPCMNRFKATIGIEYKPA
jgi:hypothetical protein